MKAQSLLAAIRAIGGVNVRELRDLSGENRTGRAGMCVGLFRKPATGSGGLKIAGFGLDELIPRLTERGFYIPEDSVDGGVEYLRDIIRQELDGEKVYSMDDSEELYQAQCEQRERVTQEPRRPSRLLELAQDLRVMRRLERKAA